MRELRFGSIFWRWRDRVHELRRRDCARVDRVNVVRELRGGSILVGVGDGMHVVCFGLLPSERRI